MTENKGGKLDLALCYLSGAMEFAPDNGVGWRRKFIDMVWDAGLNIDFLDPTNKLEGYKQGLDEDKGYQDRLQSTGEFLKLRDFVASYRRYDLRCVDYCDFIVTVVDPNIHLCGTYDEVFTAERQHRPSFFVCEGGLKRLPRWLFDVVELDDPQKGTRCNVFETLEEVVNELVALDRGELPMSDEWVLLRKYIEKNRIQNPKRDQSTL